MAELSNFVRSTLPPVIKLVEMKNDPPMPMPNTSPGSNVWLVNVRLTFALAEDELGTASPQDAQALQSAVDELSALAAWGRAYAESPYSSLYPGFAVTPPASASPKLLKVIHPKDRPLAPIYGKMAAEWQVDHWQFHTRSARTRCSCAWNVDGASRRILFSPNSRFWLSRSEASGGWSN